MASVAPVGLCGLQCSVVVFCCDLTGGRRGRNTQPAVAGLHSTLHSRMKAFELGFLDGPKSFAERSIERAAFLAMKPDAHCSVSRKPAGRPTATDSLCTTAVAERRGGGAGEEGGLSLSFACSIDCLLGFI